MQVKDVNYYELSHERVLEAFGGGVNYLGYMCYEGQPMAAYHLLNPNKDNGEKDILLLMEAIDLETKENKLWISGMDLKDFKKHSKHNAIACLSCNELLYSLERQHYHVCACENVSVSGGKEFFRYWAKNSKYLVGEYDLWSGKFKPSKKTRTKKNEKKAKRKKRSS